MRRADASGIPFARQAAFPIFYKGTAIGDAKADLIIDGRVLVELKATANYASLHLAQVSSYLRATGLTLGLLINFNVLALRHGIRRVVRTTAPHGATGSPMGSDGEATAR